MGNDGGSIPTRRELVKTAATNPSATDLKEKQREHLAHRWSQCPVSHRALAKPIVADCAGNLYNKEAILAFLLGNLSDAETSEYEAFIEGRITGLKDVVEVIFQVERDQVRKTEEKWVCPVTGKELGAAVKAVFLVPCGHAFSAEAIREVKGNDERTGECSVCGQSYVRDRDAVPILPSTDAEKEFVVKRVEILKSHNLTHSLRKSKSGKKRKNGDENGDKKNINGSGETKSDHKPNTAPTTSSTTTNGIKNSATASLTKRVLEEEGNKKKRKLDNENINSLYAKKVDGKERDGNFMTRGYSVK